MWLKHKNLILVPLALDMVYFRLYPYVQGEDGFSHTIKYWRQCHSSWASTTVETLGTSGITISTQKQRATIRRELWRLGVPEITWDRGRNCILKSQYSFNHEESDKEHFIFGDQKRSHQQVNTNSWSTIEVTVNAQESILSMFIAHILNLEFY